MSIEIRSLNGTEEIDQAFGVFLRAMVGLGFGPLDASMITEQGRYLGAVDDGTIVGGADSYTSTLVVPGGARIPHAAVTHIGVLPTHRRRGIVSALIDRQLTDVAGRGEIVATLRASEAVIYERFGYGIASATRSVRVDLRRARLREQVPIGGTVRLVDADVTDELLARIHRRAAWAGAIERPPGWWTLQRLRRVKSSVTHYVVVHSTDGVDDGYAIYRPENTESWFTSDSKTITVTDFVALGDHARAGLWRHLFTLDLVDVVDFDSLPLDDPLQLAVTDERAVHLGPAHDETWLRLVNVPEALAARSYRDAESVRIGVVDSRITANNGVVEIGPDSVRRSSAAPEVTVDVATLGAVYLGGTSWRRLAGVGRVVEHDAGALDRLDVLFATAETPYAGTTF